jgi:5-methylcytosine-specific restriction endonuclease McrA
MQKLSKAESGRLGAEKSRIITAQLKQERVNVYNLNPKTCTHCNSPLGYDERHKSFCNRSCAASYNNLKKIKNTHNTSYHCLNCNKESKFLPQKINKYCSQKCQSDFQYKVYIAEWKQNSQTGMSSGKTFQISSYVRRYLREKFENKCTSCGITEYNNKPLTMQIEHIDGDSSNNRPENLTLLCPNCHSQTDTFTGKNRGKGRHERRVRYAQGKSY